MESLDTELRQLISEFSFSAFRYSCFLPSGYPHAPPKNTYPPAALNPAHTIGNTGSDINEFIRLINPAHLKWLDQLIFEDTEKFVLVNQTLARLIKKLSLQFRELKRLADILSNKQALSKIYCPNGSVIFNGYSFSAAIKDKYLHGLSFPMREFIDG